MEALAHERLIHSWRGKGFFVSEWSKDGRKGMAEERLGEVLEPKIKRSPKV